MSITTLQNVQWWYIRPLSVPCRRIKLLIIADRHQICLIFPLFLHKSFLDTKSGILFQIFGNSRWGIPVAQLSQWVSILTLRLIV